MLREQKDKKAKRERSMQRERRGERVGGGAPGNRRVKAGVLCENGGKIPCSRKKITPKQNIV